MMKIAMSSDNNPLMNCAISFFQTLLEFYSALCFFVKLGITIILNNFIYFKNDRITKNGQSLHRDVLEFAKAQNGTRHSDE